MRRYTKASGAAESEVQIVGVNYTMTTSATLSGITAVSVDAGTKTKLASAFAAAAGLPATAVRVGAVADVALLRRRRLLAGGVTVEYIVASTDSSVISTASAGVKGGSASGVFAAALASQLSSANIAATVSSVATPVVTAKVIVEVVPSDAAVAENFSAGGVTAADITEKITSSVGRCRLT